MAGEKDVQRRLEIIEQGIRDLDALSDPGLRATAHQLVQAILDLHGTGLERLLEIVHGSGVAGPPIIDQLGRDPLVSNLLLLHSLHPLTIEARVLDALAKVRTSLASTHADVELLSIVAGAVRVRVLGGKGQEAIVERAVMDAAPDAASIDVEGAADSVVGFVSVESLRRTDAHHAANGQVPAFVRTQRA